MRTQDRGGLVDLTVGLAQKLAARPDGPEVIIAGPPPVSSAGLPWSILRQAHVRSKADLRGFAMLSELLESLPSDIIHAQDRRVGLVSSLVARGKTPTVLTYHGVPDIAAGRWVQAGPLRCRRAGMPDGSRLVADALVSGRLTLTIAPSHAMAGFLRRTFRVPAHRLCVLHNVIGIPARLGPVARKRVTERYSLARCVDDHVRLRSDILGNGRQ